MSMVTDPDTSVSGSAGGRVYRVGTLSYTRSSLTVLFAWMLWGDFCFTLMEVVAPSVIPLKLESLGTPSWVISLIMTSIPAVLNMTVCPWISFKSDRHRSRWGRRIPFILWTMPFLCLSLVMMGWSENLAHFLHGRVGFLQTMAPTTLTISLIALFMIAFQFFNMFVNSVYWYLFNDVVPSPLLGRFTGLFRFVGTGASACYNLFILQFAESNLREIATGAALLYFIGFGLMCLRVKEGQYPPPQAPPAESQDRPGRLAGIRTFMQESFSCRFYWYFYLVQTFMAVAGSVGIFQVFFLKEMGLDLKQIGYLGAVGAIAGLAAMYLAAIYVDRWHPLRIMTYMAIFGIITSCTGWIWAAVAIPAMMFFWLNVGLTLANTFGGTLNASCWLPVFMRLMPRTRYGQICSAAAMVRSAGTILAGILAGCFIDLLKYFCHGSPFAYRFLFLWGLVFNSIVALFLVLGYRSWLRQGGDQNYRPPAPWSKDGYEEVDDASPSVPANGRLLMLALRLFTIGFASNLVVILILIGWMTYVRLYHAAFMNAAVFGPVMAIITAVWLWQVRGVRHDLNRIAEGLVPRNGIPHHGVMLVMGIQWLFGMLISWAQVTWTIRLGLEWDTICFMLTSVLGWVGILPVLYILRRLERGFSSDIVA